MKNIIWHHLKNIFIGPKYHFYSIRLSRGKKEEFYPKIIVQRKLFEQIFT